MRSAIAITAMLALSGVAVADSVDLAYTGPGNGKSFDVLANGTATSVFAGQLTFNVANGSGAGAQLNGPLLTYCIDVLEGVGPGLNTYDLDDLADAPVTAGGDPAMGVEKAKAIGRLYTAAGGDQFGSDNDFAAAFQLAVWEVIADFGGDNDLDISDGDFRVTSSINAGTQSVLNGLLAAAADDSVFSFSGLGALTNEGFQDQLYSVAIPLPGAMGLAAAGLAGVGFVTRRRRM
ncbi:MAG: hypothetical protein RIE77_05960 [Phycisphaerales bacterium]|jgi:hypothetical protein